MMNNDIEFLESFGMDSEQGKELFHEIRNLHLEEAGKEAIKEGYLPPTVAKFREYRFKGYSDFVQNFSTGMAMSTIKIGMALIDSRSVDYDTISSCLEIPYELVKRLAYFYKRYGEEEEEEQEAANDIKSHSHTHGLCFSMPDDTYDHLKRMAENEKMILCDYASKIISEYVAKDKKELAAFIERHNKRLKEDLERFQKMVQEKDSYK